MSAISDRVEENTSVLTAFEMQVDEGLTQYITTTNFTDTSQIGISNPPEPVQQFPVPVSAPRNAANRSPWSVVGETRPHSERVASVSDDNDDDDDDDDPSVSFFDSFDDIGFEEVEPPAARQEHASVTADEVCNGVPEIANTEQVSKVDICAGESSTMHIPASSSPTHHNKSHFPESNHSHEKAFEEVDPRASKRRMEKQNADLRELLRGADESSAFYLQLYERVREELHNLQKTISLIMKNDDMRHDCHLMPSQSSKSSQPSQPPAEEAPWGLERSFNSILSSIMPFCENVFGQFPSSPHHQYLLRNRHRHERSQQRDAALSDQGNISHNPAFPEWRHHLSAAKRHAYNRQVGPAMESLLLAITDEDFTAWRSVLLNDARWNNLRGEDRQKWNTLIAAKLSEILRKKQNDIEGIRATAPPTDGIDYNDNEGNTEVNDRSEADVEERGEECPVKNLRPELLGAFIHQMGMWYAEKIKDRTTDAASVNMGVGLLEDLVCSAIAVFPDSAVLFYELAAIRSMQGRKEESLSLLTQVVHMDPTCLMRIQQ